MERAIRDFRVNGTAVFGVPSVVPGHFPFEDENLLRIGDNVMIFIDEIDVETDEISVGVVVAIGHPLDILTLIELVDLEAVLRNS